MCRKRQLPATAHIFDCGSSLPTCATNLVGHPSRAAAAAWLPPCAVTRVECRRVWRIHCRVLYSNNVVQVVHSHTFPPGCVVKPRAASVSPACGTRCSENTRSTFTLPATAMCFPGTTAIRPARSGGRRWRQGWKAAVADRAVSVRQLHLHTLHFAWRSQNEVAGGMAKWRSDQRVTPAIAVQLLSIDRLALAVAVQ